MNILKASFLAAILLAGCATAPAANKVAPADAGAVVDAYMRRNLRDVASVTQYEVGSAHQCNVGILGRKWCVCWQANGKNGFGGYTGVQRFIGWFDASGSGIAGATEAVRMGLGAHCLSAPLQPRSLN